MRKAGYLFALVAVLFAMTGSLSAATPTWTQTATPTASPTPTVTRTPYPNAVHVPADWSFPPIGRQGGRLTDDGYISEGSVVGDTAGKVFPAKAWQPVTAGQVVRWVASQNNYVSPTSALWDVGAVGVAVETQYDIGGLVYIARSGILDVNSSVNGAVGDIMVPGTTAGKLTGTSGISNAAVYTALSPTAFLTVLEAKTISAGNFKLHGIFRIGR